jgi:hypothetical protein
MSGAHMSQKTSICKIISDLAFHIISAYYIRGKASLLLHPISGYSGDSKSSGRGARTVPYIDLLGSVLELVKSYFRRLRNQREGADVKPRDFLSIPANWG